MDDDHNNNADDLVDKVYMQMTTLLVSPTYTAVTRYNGHNGAGSIKLQFRVLCQEGYHGSACNQLCLPADNDTSGHYTCGSNGLKICSTGWENATNNCLTRKRSSMMIILTPPGTSSYTVITSV